MTKGSPTCAAFGHVEPTFPESVGALRNQIRSVISSLPLAGYPCVGTWTVRAGSGKRFRGRRPSECRRTLRTTILFDGCWRREGRAASCLNASGRWEGAARRRSAVRYGSPNLLSMEILAHRSVGEEAAARGCAKGRRGPNYAHLIPAVTVGAARPGPRVETSSPPTSTGSFGTALCSRP